MTSRLFRYMKHDLITGNIQQIRFYRHHGKSPLEAKTLKQRLEELNYKDPEISFKVDIGFKSQRFSRGKLTEGYSEYVKKVRSNPEMERKARRKELLIDLDQMRKDWWISTAPSQIKTIADHYGVYDDLFGDAYFHPVLPLDIKYDFGDEEKIATVHRGNILLPSETTNPPTITYDAEPDTLWTLLLTTPDGNFSDRKFEYCHWFIGNIPGNDVTKGDVIVDYMRPFPAHGIGYCRYIFVLYKQDKKIDFSEYKVNQPCFDLVSRNWETKEFYRKYQDVITPAGLGFYQATWDQSVQDFYHNELDMKAPMFEYDFPKPYIRPQEWFPKAKPFNLYMDKYRDPKKINQEFLMKKMKTVHPFKESPPPLRYPNAQPLPKDMPSWLKLETKKERQGFGRVNDIN
ncbi:hypothetical protein PV325_009879 [Microctonus aethiopoides]|uniref:Large ribosomal subunit protein mL38 n=1 Tax=Microctonus aethiopoides TaxID=144406 RepID=A0AA39KXR9_9HYME|nr:hypothetical protein PV325_009879 [Microctonus aethiopoides]KAK0177655.1 hypothetical protein PV328_001688 [Microctonus aethiopoides]